jgi:hypothetical protein
MKVIEQLRAMSEERFFAIYESLQNQGFGPLDGEVARSLKFRPQAVKKLPLAQRARRAQSILTQTSNAELTYELFGSYLMTNCKELVTDFLDATGVEHEDGMISNIDSSQPAVDKLSVALQELDSKYNSDDVTLYLALCVEQWPSVGELESLWALRP